MIDGVKEYLTRSYVDWLRLREVPFEMSQPTAVLKPRKMSMGEFVDRYHANFPTGVIYEGRRYVRSHDGLSFDLCAADRFGVRIGLHRPMKPGEAFSASRRLGFVDHAI